MTEVYDRIKSALEDRYVIEHELGSGGMATVYLAEDVKHRDVSRVTRAVARVAEVHQLHLAVLEAQ